MGHFQVPRARGGIRGRRPTRLPQPAPKVRLMRGPVHKEINKLRDMISTLAERASARNPPSKYEMKTRRKTHC